MYDVTSSYFEGARNACGKYGYNRDGKRGKLRIVVGLLTHGDGAPVSVEVFDGDTQDPKTVVSQIRKLAGRFGVLDVTFVGDRGMIKSAQIEQLGQEHFHYLTAITKTRIQTLLNSGALQLEMFDEALCEVAVEGARYIPRRDPVRAAEISAARRSKFQTLERLAEKNTAYLEEHARAQAEVALRDVQARAARLRVEHWVEITGEERRVRLAQNPAALKDAGLLDGCYVLKTDVALALAGADQLHARYHDLARVERAFRTMKTGRPETRPVYVRAAAHARARAFIVMLAYLLRREIETAWRARDLTVEEAIAQLSALCAQEVFIGQKAGYLQVPQPREATRELFEDCDVAPPETLPRRQSTVATKRKLPARRLQR